MCGIIAYMGSMLSFDEFKKRSKTISHRGPDSTVHHCINNTFFGFHRLRINDQSERADQPFINDSVLLMCNGEIYNSKELIKKYNLENKMESSSDCEVILHLYTHFNGDIGRISNELRGVFAFILYDRKTKTMYISRDPLGIRSLYIGYTKDTSTNSISEFMVASELRTMKDLNIVNQFPPNHYATFKDGLLFFTQYFDNSLDSTSSTKNIPETIYKLLDEAVKIRTQSDRPIGCLLSGGLDSSVIAYLLSKYIPNLNTYSIGLSSDSPDLKYARIVAKSIGSIHHEIVLPEQDFLNAIPSVIETIESYDTTTVRASVPMYLLCKYIKENTDNVVIFSGEFSDELFGGYLYFHKAPTDQEFQNETTRLINDIHLFDGLRADKTISRNSLEARIPFSDKKLVKYVYNLPASYKRNEVEKYILRKAFDKRLPDSIIWRTKEAFSDGVSTKENSWYKIIQNHVETLELPINDYKINTPVLKESLWYRHIFANLFPNRDTVLPYYWLPRWSGDIQDPSARVLDNYKD
jgi:asparagine synthase (glutamine-hydrolysing)